MLVLIDEEHALFLDEHQLEAEAEVDVFARRIGFAVENDSAFGCRDFDPADFGAGEPVDDVLTRFGSGLCDRFLRGLGLCSRLGLDRFACLA